MTGAQKKWGEMKHGLAGERLTGSSVLCESTSKTLGVRHISFAREKSDSLQFALEPGCREYRRTAGIRLSSVCGATRRSRI